MSKFYVDSGNLQFVGESHNEIDAVERAITQAIGTIELGRIIRVNEQGFSNNNHVTDVFLDTVSVLHQLGIAD